MEQPILTPQNWSLPMDFNPFTQNVTLLMRNGTDGSTLITIPLSLFNSWKVETQETCINYGSQLGASLMMMMLMVAITTRQSKRNQPIFWLNMLSLLLAFIRALLQALFYVGPFQDVYRFMSSDYSDVSRREYNQSVLGVMATLLLLCTIEASLVLQTNEVCLTMAQRWRWVVVCFSIIVVLLTCVSRVVYTVTNIEGILATLYNGDTMMLAKLNLITETASIWYFCAVFVGKLAWTMYIRKRMGIKQWGPMQIICISGGCTLIIPCKFTSSLTPVCSFTPASLNKLAFTRHEANFVLSPAIFAVLEWFPTQTFPDAGSLALTVVAIFLPLSSVWASMSVSDNHSPVRMQEHRLKFCSHDSRSGDHTMATAAGMAIMDSRRGLIASIAGDRKSSCCSGKSAFGTNSIAVEDADDHDMEAQKQSNQFFGMSKFGQKGHSTTIVRKGSDANLADEDIETQDGVRIERVFNVQRCVSSTADGDEWAKARTTKTHKNRNV